MTKRFVLFFVFILMAGTFNALAQTGSPAAKTDDASLIVSPDFFVSQKNLAMAKRKAPTGVRPRGMIVPNELLGDGVIKQKAKLSEMIQKGYLRPLDFADLADKLLKNELIELPMATQEYILNVGGNADDSEFHSFSFENGSAVLAPDSPKYLILKRLADNFNGQKYDLDNPKDRRAMRIRLLRTLNPAAKVVLEEIAAAYYKRFKRPLIVSGMSRSIEYQILLSQTDSNMFKVTGEGSLPPHSSGLAFDFSRVHMTAEEQNFVMQKIAELERRGLADGLVEYGTTPVFHVFVYFDGLPPKNL